MYISKPVFSEIKKYYKNYHKEEDFNNNFIDFIIITLEEEKDKNNLYYPYYTSSNLILRSSDYEKVLNHSYKEYKKSFTTQLIELNQKQVK